MNKTFSRWLKGILAAGLTAAIIVTPTFAMDNDDRTDEAEGLHLAIYNVETGEWTYRVFYPNIDDGAAEGSSPAYDPEKEML